MSDQIIKKHDDLSSGFIIYRENSETTSIEYLILQSSKNSKNLQKVRNVWFIMIGSFLPTGRIKL